MKKGVRVLIFVGTLLSWGPLSASGQNPPFTQCPAIGADTSCAVLIIINPDITAMVRVDPSQGPFDDIEDTLVGVKNNSNQTVFSLSLSSSMPIFGFDGDGFCSPFFTPHPAGCPFGPTGYEGPGVSFSNINAAKTSGIVNFSGGIAPGGSVFFGLEESPSTAQISAGAAASSGPSFLAASGTPINPTLSSPEPVNTATGNYYTTHSDLLVAGRGFAFIFTRAYNSRDTYSGPLGAAWTHSYNVLLIENTGNGIVSIKQGDGANVSFMPTGGGSYSALTTGLFDILKKNGDGSFTLTRKSQTRLNFSSLGRLTSIVDRSGNTQVLSYDVSANLTSVTDASGRVFVFSYDAQNRLVSVTDPGGRVLQYLYDAAGNLVSYRDALGGLTQYAYDSSHRITSATDPRGVVFVQNAYDPQGRATSQTNGRGFAWAFAYATPNPGDTTITDARGNKTIHSYDGSLRIVKITDTVGSTTSFTYDANNDRTSVTNQNAKTTSFAYDTRGNVTGITDPLANAVSFSYDAKNNLLTATNANGKTTSFTYDGNGNLTKIQDALANTTTFAYDNVGQLTSKTDARGNTTTFSYDSSGNLSRITDALSHTTTLSYDGIGRLISITDPNGHTATATYDALSRLIKIADPLGNQTKFDYDPVGNLLKITDADGNATNYAYDTTNNLVTVTDTLGHITRYAYDANNNRVSFTNAKGNATSYAYDALNRLSHITDPLSFVTSYSYDPVGNVQATTDPKAQTNQFTYDALNRLLSIAYADGKNVAYSYDVNGNRTSMVDSNGTTAYAYDTLDRLTSVTNPGGKVVTYAFDAVGNRKSLTYPDGKPVNYSFDSTNRLASVKDWLGRTTTYSYDAASNLTSTLYPNSAALGFSYDAANRLAQVRNSYRGSAGNPVSNFTYALDSVGNRLQVTDGSGVVTSYTYDPLYELTSANRDGKVTNYGYDTVGNRLSLTAPGTSINYSYDADDRLLAAGTSTFTYDANGNQITKTQTATGRPIAYAYDAANRLSSATFGAATSTFAYDGDGNRISQSVGTGNYNYLNDVATALPVVLQESGPDGNISYAYGLGLVSESSPAFDNFYHYDGLGGVVGLTDAAGKLAGRYAYDAWGQPDLSAPGPQLGTKNKFRFTGEALDPGTQLYYLRARYYDPTIGRFIAIDPLGGVLTYPLSTNRYHYALSNPLRYTDPSGLSAAETSSLFGPFDPSSVVSFFFNTLPLNFADILIKGTQFYVPTWTDFGDLQRVFGELKFAKNLSVVGLAIGAYQDLTNPNLSLGVKIGKLSIGIIVTTVGGPVGAITWDAFNTFLPKQTDAFFNDAYKSIGNAEASTILWGAKLLGKEKALQDWASKPSWLDW